MVNQPSIELNRIRCFLLELQIWLLMTIPSHACNLACTQLFMHECTCRQNHGNISRLQSFPSTASSNWKVYFMRGFGGREIPRHLHRLHCTPRRLLINWNHFHSHAHEKSQRHAEVLRGDAANMHSPILVIYVISILAIQRARFK